MMVRAELKHGMNEEEIIYCVIKFEGLNAD